MALGATPKITSQGVTIGGRQGSDFVEVIVIQTHLSQTFSLKKSLARNSQCFLLQRYKIRQRSRDHSFETLPLLKIELV